MQGTLTKISLPDLLRTLYTERHTGELVLTQGIVKKNLYFELGQLVFASSNRNEDRLGEALVRHGKLTRTQLDQYLATLSPGQHLGKALVEQEVLSNRELITYVTFQLLDIVYSLFTWTLGNFEFTETEESLAPEQLKLRLSTATIILEGVRRIEDFDVIRRGLGDLNRLFAPSSSPLLRLQSITLKPTERQILDMVTQPMDLLKIIISIHEPSKQVLQALYGLTSVGLLQQTGSAILSDATGTFVVPDMAKKQAESAPPVEYAARATGQLRLEDAALIAEISSMKERILSQDPRAILGITSQSGAGEMRDAYYRLATQFHPDKFIQSSRQVREEADYIFTKITESYNRLRSGITAANIRPTIPAMPIPAVLAANQDLTPTSAPSSPPAKPDSQVYEVQSYNFYPPPASDAAAAGAPQSGAPASYKTGQYNAAPTSSSSYSASQNYVPPGYAGHSASRGTTRPISDEMGTPSMYMHKMPQRGGAASGKVDIEGALNDLLDFLDDRKAPLFVADSLSLLFRSKPPIYVDQTRVIETIVTWSRQKASIIARPIHEIFIAALGSIRHAEQARVLKDFEPATFYGNFINELAGYCPANERQEFLNKAGNL